jgi:hypothetical protein
VLLLLLLLVTMTVCLARSILPIHLSRYIFLSSLGEPTAAAAAIAAAVTLGKQAEGRKLYRRKEVWIMTQRKLDETICHFIYFALS